MLAQVIHCPGWLPDSVPLLLMKHLLKSCPSFSLEIADFFFLPFIVSGMVLCFDFSRKIMLITVLNRSKVISVFQLLVLPVRGLRGYKELGGA